MQRVNTWKTVEYPAQYSRGVFDRVAGSEERFVFFGWLCCKRHIKLLINRLTHHDGGHLSPRSCILYHCRFNYEFDRFLGEDKKNATNDDTITLLHCHLRLHWQQGWLWARMSSAWVFFLVNSSSYCHATGSLQSVIRFMTESHLIKVVMFPAKHDSSSLACLSHFTRTNYIHKVLEHFLK